MKYDGLPILPLLLDRVPRSLRQAIAQEGIPTLSFQQHPCGGRFVLWDSKGQRGPDAVRGQVLIDIDLLRRQEEGDPLERLIEKRSARVAWEIGEFQASEEVARIDRRALRRRLMDRLRNLVERMGGIWLRVGAFPYPYRSAFNFRIDYDEYESHDFHTMLAALRGYEDATSHYVCGSTYEPHPEAIERLRGLDVGSHGYRHHTYLDTSDNLSNIRRGIEVLQRQGIEPSGFTAPHGRFNSGLLAALHTLGVTHSSEFGLAYDELPFWPDEGKVLQIPIHPICLGIVLEAARRQAGDDLTAQQRAAAAVAEHFRATAQRKYEAGEPVFLYGHPTARLGRYPHVLRAALESTGHFAAIWHTTLSEFASWWRARAAVRIRAFSQADKVVLCVDRAATGFRLGAEFCRGEHVAPLPLSQTRLEFSPQALVFQRRRPVEETARAIRIDSSHSLRGSLLRYLDWEKVTPVNEISKRSLRGWMKHTLRRMRS